MKKPRTAERNPLQRDKALGHRLQRMRTQSMKPVIAQCRDGEGAMKKNVVLDCGWGRLLFDQTFEDKSELIDALREEQRGQRDIVFYVRDPHVILAVAPQETFLDPSHTFRLDFSTYRTSRRKQQRGFFIRRLTSEDDARAVNNIYAARSMVTLDPSFFRDNRNNRSITYFVAEEEGTGDIIGTVTGIDHTRLFNDPEKGSSLWCLAVDPRARHPGVGEMLVRRLAEHFSARGSAYLDLSVLHDNDMAVKLYEKLGFHRVPVFAVKRKNPINEKLFAAPIDEYSALNPYARLIVDEARRRGIHTEISDAAGGFFKLSYGGREIRCRESLSELTSAVAMSICDDKAVTRRVVEKAGLRVPEQIEATDDKQALAAFLKEHGSVVVKPARGEQGRGIAVGITTMDALQDAIAIAREVCDRVIIESCFEGEDLRLVVIDYKLVAAALRKPPRVIGDGQTSVRALIEKLSRRRQAATDGESRIPMDSETVRCVEQAGYSMDSVLEEGQELVVRKTANLHMGGSIHDVTDRVHPTLVDAARKAARAIGIPVVGIDLMIEKPTGANYVFIEANERPGLANHEPQPIAERFVDLLFPQSRIRHSETENESRNA